MAVKKIQPMRIQAIKASIIASTEEISKGMESLIEAPVTGSLDSCASLAKSCMEDLVETVDSLDLFLNNVAEAFQNLDKDLSKSIKSNDMYTVSPQEHTERKRIQQKTYDASMYRELP